MWANCENFKNLNYSLAYRHQLWQAYYSAGSLFHDEVSLDGCIPLRLECISDAAKSALLAKLLCLHGPCVDILSLLAVVKIQKTNKGACNYMGFWVQSPDALVPGYIEGVLGRAGEGIAISLQGGPGVSIL